MTAQFENLIDLDRLELFLQLLDAGGSSDTVLYEAAAGQNGLQIPQGSTSPAVVVITDTFDPYNSNYFVEAVFMMGTGSSAKYMQSVCLRLPQAGGRARLLLTDGASAVGEIVVTTSWVDDDHWEIQLYTSAAFTNAPYLQRLVHVS